jgi:hypothetical protein
VVEEVKLLPRWSAKKMRLAVRIVLDLFDNHIQVAPILLAGAQNPQDGGNLLVRCGGS